MKAEKVRNIINYSIVIPAGINVQDKQETELETATANKIYTQKLVQILSNIFSQKT